MSPTATTPTLSGTLILLALLSGCDDSTTTPTDVMPVRPAVPGQLVYGLTASNTLVTLDAGQANQVGAETAITGLMPGERIIGIDFRPSDLNGDGVDDTGKLYGVGSASRVYLIDPLTGQAGPGLPLVTATGAAVTLSGTSFGVGFNPVPDRLRVHSDADQNLRVNVDNGVTAVDTALSYPADGANPAIVGTGYTNNDNDPATGTTLFALDADRDVLAVFDIPSGPNSGKISVVGFTGVNTAAAAGFDIAGLGNVAYAAFSDSPSGKSTLYTIDLVTGAASKLRLIAQGKSPLVSIAVAP